MPDAAARLLPGITPPALPRAGWLALGAVVAALLLSGTDGWFLSFLALAGLGSAIALARRRRPGAAALLIGFSTVALRIAIASLLAGPATAPDVLTPGSGEWRATVVDVTAPAVAEQRGFLEIEPRAADDGTRQGAFLVYGRMPRHPALVPGDIIEISGELERRPTDGSGFAGYLERRGAIGTLRVRSMQLGARGSDALALVEQLRWTIDGAIARVLPEPEAGLAAGILIGLRERVGRAVAEDFTITGLTHVVAISGWNIALVAGIATSLLRATGLRRRPRSAVVLAAIVGYSVIAGAEASVIRAAAMGGVVLLAREGGRPAGAAAALGVACWGLLLVEPAMIEDIGLQLSLAATAGLLALGEPATAAVRRLTRRRAPTWFEETLGISLAAQLSTLPLILLHFGRLSLVSPLANLLVAPVVPLAMLGALIGVVVAPLAALPLDLLLLPLTLGAWLPLALMVRGASLLATVPFANLELAAPLDLAGAALALLALSLALRASRSRRRDHLPDAAGMPQRPASASASAAPARGRRLAVLATAAILGVTSAAVLLQPAAGVLRVTVLDIGQGDAILLEGRRGTRLLVDGGPDPDLLVRRLDERIPMWDRHIDMAIVTHPHEDHAGGIAGLTPRYRLDAVAETGLRSLSAGITELRAVAARTDMAHVRLTQGDRLDLDGARIDVLWPPRHAVERDSPPTSGRVINDTSIVLHVSIGRHHLLLTGDLEDDKDDDLLGHIPRSIVRWDLLKVAHHGSATASSRPLLEALRPRVAVVSAGAGNTYGHPASSTLGRLRDVGAIVRRTDVSGSLSMTFDGHSRGSASILRPRPLRRALRCPAGASAEPVTRQAAPGPPTAAGWSCYAPPDGGPHTSRSPGPPPVRLAVAEAPQARHRGRRDRRLPRPACQPGRCARRPTPGGGCRAPPRCRQGTAAGPPAATARTRPRGRGLAQRSRPSRARPQRRGPSGHAPR